MALGPVAIAASAQRQHVQCGHPHLRHAHHGDHDLFFVRLAHMQVGVVAQRLPANGLRLGQETVVCPLLVRVMGLRQSFFDSCPRLLGKG